MRYGGGSKEVIDCSYCHTANVVRDRIESMRDLMAGLDLAAGSRRFHLLREAVKGFKFRDFQDIPDFSNLLLPHIENRFGAFVDKRTGISHMERLAVEKLFNTQHPDIAIHVPREKIYRLRHFGTDVPARAGLTLRLSSYRKLPGFATGEYDGERALGLVRFSRETFAHASAIAQIIASYYGVATQLMVREGPGPVLIWAGPVIVSIGDHNHLQFSDKLLLSAALAKKGVTGPATAVTGNQLVLACAEVLGGESDAAREYWSARFIKQTFKMTDQITSSYKFINPWPDAIALEEKWGSRSRWYLTSEGFSALQAYKHSLLQAQLPVPPLLRKINSKALSADDHHKIDNLKKQGPLEGRDQVGEDTLKQWRLYAAMGGFILSGLISAQANLSGNRLVHALVGAVIAFVAGNIIFRKR